MPLYSAKNGILPLIPFYAPRSPACSPLGHRLGAFGAQRRKNRWGYIEGVHYVVGKKPLKSFARPITEPNDYEHVISFYNGSIAVIISQDRPGSSNSLTLSWLLVDEAKFINYEKLKVVIAERFAP